MHRTHFFAWAILGLVLVAVLAVVVGVATHAFYTYPAMMPYYGGWWFFFPFGFIFIFFIFFVVSRLLFWPWGGYRRGYYRYGDAREILRQRYARGEITKDQFDQMMRDLEQHS